jgi:glutamate/tyrosine decarboxylase-like PLP-dependent enzyme
MGHAMLDDMFDHLSDIRQIPVWQKMPIALRSQFRTELPRDPTDLVTIYQDYQRLIQSYSGGNLHPRFMGWVQGGGNPVAMLAEMLSGGLNGNLGGRDHAPIEVERQVIAWAAEITGFPASASGVLVTGTSIANLIGVLVARRAVLGPGVRSAGLQDARVTAYAATGAHGCVMRAMDMAGLGTDALRLIPLDEKLRMDMVALANAIARDRADGAHPFLVVGTAGSVDTGAVDDLAAIAALCKAEGLWFHVDGAFGALAALAPRRRALLAGMERADSLALDFHKWAQVQYDCGCILVRDPVHQTDTFAQSVDYLRRDVRGLAGGHPWPCDLGPDLSRGFRALKVWMTLRAYGTVRLGEVVEQCCALATRLAARIDAEPALERLAPVPLNIVCFRVRDLDDAANAALVADLHEDGSFAPSTTRIGGRTAIRAAIVNHRTRADDVDGLVDAILAKRPVN